MRNEKIVVIGYILGNHRIYQYNAPCLWTDSDWLFIHSRSARIPCGKWVQPYQVHHFETT